MATREVTNKILEMIDECGLNARDVALMCLKWMSEDDVKEMCEVNEIYFEEDDIDAFYHDYSEDELRRMGCFDNLNDCEDEEDD